QYHANMLTIYVCILHDDDPAVTELGDIKAAFILAVAILFRFADACANGSDHRLDLVVLEKLIFTRFLDVDQLAANRQDRLITTIAALLGGSSCGITFDNVKLRQFGIALRAVG